MDNNVALDEVSLQGDTKLIFLDQHHWIALLRADGIQSVEILDLLRSTVESGRVVVPLVGGHYLEAWHRPKWQSRSALAALMRDISKWRTLAPPQRIAQLEIERALTGRTPPQSEDFVGTGVNHAFASATGRFRLVERAWSNEHPEEGPEIPGIPGDMQRLQELSPEAWEWLNLAGPEDLDFPLPGFAADQFDIRPEHRRGDEFIADERDLVARLTADGLLHRLRDALVMLDLQELLDDINESCVRLGIDPDVLRSPEALPMFHSALPSRHLLADLRSLRLQDPSLPLEQHDRTDLLGLAATLVYCDVVVTERRWAHFARRAGVKEGHGTTVLGRLADLKPILESWI
jgi:hypothetical protein